MKKYRHTLQYNMAIASKQKYSVGQKIFCCKCFECLQTEVILTSNIRRQNLQKMIKNFVIDYEHDDGVLDSLKLMIMVYLCLDQKTTTKFINRCQINPDHSTERYRTDLQFYIPQVCNYLVFHNDLNEDYLTEAISKACKTSFYFAHAYYFYIASLEKIVGEQQIQTFKKVTDYKNSLLDQLCKFYRSQMLNSLEFFVKQSVKTVPVKSDIGYLLKMYGTKQSYKQGFVVKSSDITLPNYSSVFNKQSQTQVYSFKSTINFFQDLFRCSQQLKNYENQQAKLLQFLREINSNLPACVYVPFIKNSNSYYNILNIVVQQTKIFSTKMRAPFYICLEVYNPIEGCPQNIQNEYKLKLKKPITIRQAENNGSRKSDEQIKVKHKKDNIRPKIDTHSTISHTQTFGEENSSQPNRLVQYVPQAQSSLPNSKEIQMKGVKRRQLSIIFHKIFGQSQRQINERIRQNSIFKDLQTWKLIHLIVKTGDNLKQQQFALQLIYQFDYIFKLQNLPLLLTPYQVLSMSPDCGIIQMVRDSITFDKLKKHLKNDFGKELTLKQFFEINFIDNLAEAKDIFMRSLAAYSLVMYFLQAKDRHNGNILLHKSGKIFHIDFGFFLSNLPGKGVELQKDCPFKLLTEYIEVLDGYQSYYFKKFREYLFLGFKAIRKHQDKILLLVKMMYSSSGTSMPCFEKGQEAIREIELRFNPNDVLNDAELNLHCQKLINNSLDNWATKWYDRFQYFAQGIFY